MNEITKKIVKEYQCPGCVGGGDMHCYESRRDSKDLSCASHVAGTTMGGIGRIFLGMPKGFNRLGLCDGTKISIYKKLSDCFEYDFLNVPVWKYLDDHGNTLVRGICPRINNPWIHIFIGDCLDQIECFEITEEHINEID